MIRYYAIRRCPGRQRQLFLVMKTIQSLLLCCAALLLLALPAPVQAQFTFTTNNGAITITRYTGPGGAVAIPDATNGWPVTSIGDYAFEWRFSLASVTIPDSVTNIGFDAFYYCPNLTNVTIGAGVASIGGEAFQACSSLTAITVAANNSDFSSAAGVLFNQSQTTLILYPEGEPGNSYTIPDGVTNIADAAFKQCGSLTNVTIPEGVTSLGDSAFYLCTGLASVTIPGSVTHIGSQAFDGCTRLSAITVATNNPAFSSVAGVLFNQNQTTLILFPEGEPENSYTIPDSVTNIRDLSFEQCTSLSDVTIPDSVINIGYEAFQQCASLTNVTIPGSVTSIGDQAFYGCAALAGVTLSNGVASIGENAFSGCGLTSVLIPKSVTTIGEDAFQQCPNLTAITVAAGNPAFSSVAGVLFNQNQTTLIQFPAGKAGGSYPIPDRVTSIGDDAFQYCTGLQSVTIPTSVISIGIEAFEACGSLTSLTIPDSVTSIGGEAFQQCTSLTSVAMPDSVTSLGYWAFYGCTSLTNITIPNGVTSLGELTFWGCTSLTSVTIPAAVTDIGESAFASCNDLTEVYFLGNAPSADSTVFNGDNNVTVYYLPDTTGWSSTFAGAPTATWNPPLGSVRATILPAAAIAAGAQWQVDDGTWQSSGATLSNLLVGEHTVSFSAATGWIPPANQTVFVISNHLTTVSGTYVSTPFNYAINDGAITITGYTGPGGAVTIPGMINGLPVTGIGNGSPYGYAAVFSGNSVTSVTIPSSVTSIEEAAFQDCASLTAITVAASNPSYSSVAGALFDKRQTTLIQYPQGKTGSSYTIPSTVTSIGDEAFEDCANLSGVTIPDSVTNIGDEVFFGCFRLTSVAIPNSVISIGDEAFAWCNTMTNVTISTNVTSIGDEAFSGCNRLPSVTIPGSVTSIGLGAFNYCSSLAGITVAADNAAYSSLAGVLFNENQTLLLQYPGGKAGDYTVPDSVTSIEYNAFTGCTSLTGITIPVGVTNLDDTTTIAGPYFGAAPFSGCVSLSAITVASGNPAYSSVGGVLFNQDQTTLIEYPEGKAGSSYTIPESVTNIADFAFEQCNSLAGVFFQGNAPGVGWGVFNSDNLTVYYLPDTTGWGSTFGGAPATSWNPSAGVLQVTILPAEAGYAGAQWQVDDGIWQNSGEIATNLSLGEHIVNFNTINGWTPPASQTVLVGSNAVTSATGTYVQIPFEYTTNQGTVTIIGYSGPGGAVTIPDTINGLPVTSIEGFAFMAFGGPVPQPIILQPPQLLISPISSVPIVTGPIATGPITISPINNLPITSIPIPRVTTTSGPITSVTIPSSVTNISYGVFRNCPKLAAIMVAAGNPAYGSVAGVLLNKSQTALIEYPAGKTGSRYVIPNSVTSIGDYAFYGCSNLTSVTIGNRVNWIGYDAFVACSSLAAFTVDGNNPAYGTEAGVLFNKDLTTLVQYPDDKAGTSYLIPSSVTSIGASAFANCDRLTSVTMPGSVKDIGAGAFEFCTNLASVAIGSHVVSIGMDAFRGCTRLTSVNIPESAINIGSTAFLNCSSLTAITVAGLNPAYVSEAGVWFNKKQTTLIQYPAARAGTSYSIPSRVLDLGNSAFANCMRLTSVTIPNSVTNIGQEAFFDCTNLSSVMIGSGVVSIGLEAFWGCASLTSVTLPGRVTSIGELAFWGCTNLKGVYFQGDAPNLDTNGYGGEILSGDNNATAYYLPGTTGWGSTFGGIPTALWSVRVRSDVSLGVRANRFGFNLTGWTNQIIVVEACTNLFNPVWQPLQTNTLTGGSVYFTDPQWTNYPSRFYRIRSP